MSTEERTSIIKVIDELTAKADEAAAKAVSSPKWRVHDARIYREREATFLYAIAALEEELAAA